MFPGKDARQIVETLRPALQVQPVPDSELYDLNVALPSRAHSLAVLALWCEAWAAFGDARSNNNPAAEMLSETAGDLERQLADAERALLETHRAISRRLEAYGIAAAARHADAAIGAARTRTGSP